MSLSVWSVHRRLVAAGRDAPAPGAGWPRPLYDGLPHTYLTPVAAGRAWWRHVDALRLEQCQTQWLCQVCGLRLEHQAWLLVDAGGLVLMSSALHRRCVDLSMARCPALSIEQPTERQVVREQILVNGRPWPLVYATNRPEGILPALWTLATPIA
ncbi:MULTISPECIES: hypothetical protein [Actinosynnema]|uniref:hypothetical protein n=1 Tax=Actinosynnema TaxID=40566 RepID=UPI0020A423C5|nr:hypothetical protein [Actinosynnema pretiosum]